MPDGMHGKAFHSREFEGRAGFKSKYCEPLLHVALMGEIKKKGEREREREGIYLRNPF